MTVSVTQLGANHTQNNTQSSLSVQITTAADVLAGSVIAVVIGQRGGSSGGSAPASISDSAGNSYALVIDEGPGGTASVHAGIWEASNVAFLAAGSTITVTWSSNAPGDAGASAIAISGMAISSIVDADAGNNNAGGSSTSPTVSVTTANANDVIVGVVTFANSSAFTQDAAFSDITGWDTSGATVPEGTHAGYKIVSSAGSQTYNPTLGTARQYAAAIAGLKQASAPASSIAQKAVHLQNMMRAA